MEEIFGRVGGRFRISITDSTMMWILHCAMDKAHERAKSKEGVVERLNEISKFYELAVMQLEGCLKFIQEETDNGFQSCDEDVLGDLTDIRDRLQGRLEESEHAISEKDRELNERLKNEWTLRQALECKERELDSLRKKLELKRTSSEELVLSNRVSTDEDRDEEFSELKNSVDQQVWNIKQKLGPDYKLIDRRRNKSFDDIKIDQMSSDIDILKGTMDLAFGKMQCAISLSELGPVEQQWGWTIERDAMSILIKGFMEDVQENFEAELSRHKKQFSIGLTKHLLDLEKELTCLHDEIESVSTTQHNLEPKKGKGRSSSVPCDSTAILEEVDRESRTDDGSSNFVAKMIKNHESIIRKKSEETWLKREMLCQKRSLCTKGGKEPISPIRKINDIFIILDNLISWNTKLHKSLSQCGGDRIEEIYSKNKICDSGMTEEESSQFDTLEDVWKKVNQSSVSHAVNLELQNQISRLETENADENFEMKITKMIYTSLLQGFVHDWTAGLQGYKMEMAKREGIYEDSFKKKVTEWNRKLEIDKVEVQIREEIYCAVFVEVVKGFFSIADSALIECQDARAKSKILEDNCLEGRLREEICGACFVEISKEWNQAMEKCKTEYQDAKAVNISLEDNVLEERVKEEICSVYFMEISKEGNEVIERCETECQDARAVNISFEDTILEERLTEDICGVCFMGMSNDLKEAMEKCQEAMSVNICSEDNALKERFMEEITSVCFREISKEWNEQAERYQTEHLVKKESYQIASVEIIRDSAETANQMLTKFRHEEKNSDICITCSNESSQCVQYSIAEDTCIAVMKETFKEWKEKIGDYNLESLIREEIYLLYVQEVVQQASTLYEEAKLQAHSNALEDLLSTNKSCGSAEASNEENATSETREDDVNFDPLGVKQEDVVELKTAQKLLVEMKCSSNSVSRQIQKASEQIDMSKALLSLLRSSLCMGVEDIERVDKMSPVSSSMHNKTFSQFQSEDNQASFDSATNPVVEFLRVFMDFKCRVEEKLECNILRLEEATHQLNPLLELVASLRTQEWLCRNAFIRRCESLKRAETEVDLLADQVELLVSLLEKIYNTLNYYSPELEEQYIEVSDILMMIKKEVVGRGE